MSKSGTSALDSLPVFFAHALALETEAAERYQELADVMAVHNNPVAAELFQKLAGYGHQHAAEVREMMENAEPVSLAPWEYDWGGVEAPETSAMADADYRMTSAHVMQMALKTEQAAHDYYASVAANASDDEVRRLAQEFAEEEAGHVQYVKQWISRNPVALEELPEDDDPANMPE